MSETPQKCELCGFEGPLQKHHLVPQRVSRHKNRCMKGDPSNHAFVCEVCHRTIHAYYSEAELKSRLDTVEALKSDERFSKYLSWRSRHMNYGTNSTKMSNRRKT